MTTKTEIQTRANERYAALAEGRTVADLVGSAAQITWATDIRAAQIADMYWSYNRPGDDIDLTTAAVGILLRIRGAGWWIDNRFAGVEEMFEIATGLVAKSAR